MPDNSMVKKVYEWSPTQTRSLGRPKKEEEEEDALFVIPVMFTVC